MPELPEVETICRQLNQKIVAKTITNVEIIDFQVIKEPESLVFKKKIIGQKIKEVLRRGKLLIIALDSSMFLTIHLRISGWLFYGKKQTKARVVFSFDNGVCLNYMDSRLLGELRLVNSYQDMKFIKELGPEPFQLTVSSFRDNLKSKKGKIKSLLLDQKFIAGIGNIYAQEALFFSKINPLRVANSLTEQEVELLYKSIIKVLNQGIKYGGASVDSYQTIEGESGGMQNKLCVYGRQNKACFICGAIIKKILIAGRGTCFCSNCQK